MAQLIQINIRLKRPRDGGCIDTLNGNAYLILILFVLNNINNHWKNQFPGA